MNNTVLAARAVTKEYGAGSARQAVLDNLTLDIREGDFTVIMGPSGAGKSTLLHVLSGMDRASSGSVSFGEVRVDQLDGRGMAALRRTDFGFVFQQSRLVSNLTLLENVVVAGYLANARSPRQVRERANRLLARMNVGQARDRLPAHVSGGEAQRASIARAVVNEPAILFADEPTGSLNRAATREVLDLFTGLNREGQSILMVTHDAHAALRGNRIVYLADGAVSGDLTLAPFGTDNLEQREALMFQWLAERDW